MANADSDFDAMHAAANEEFANPVLIRKRVGAGGLGTLNRRTLARETTSIEMSLDAERQDPTLEMRAAGTAEGIVYIVRVADIEALVTAGGVLGVSCFYPDGTNEEIEETIDGETVVRTVASVRRTDDRRGIEITCGDERKS